MRAKSLGAVVVRTVKRRTPSLPFATHPRPWELVGIDESDYNATLDDALLISDIARYGMNEWDARALNLSIENARAYGQRLVADARARRAAAAR